MDKKYWQEGKVNQKSSYSAMELNLLIAQGLEEKEMARLVVTAIPSLVEVTFAALGLLEKGGTNWLVVGRWRKRPLDTAVVEELASVLASGLSQQVFRSAGSLLLADFPSAAGRVPEPLAKLGVKSLLVAPARTINNSFGVMMVGREVAEGYTLDERFLISTVVNQMAVALENGRLLEQTHDSEEHYRQLFEGINDAVMVHGLQGRFLDCNETTLQRLGYSRQEFLRLRVADIVHPDFHVVMKDNQKRIWAGENTIVESVHWRKDGRVIPVEVNARRIEYKGESAILAVVRDITERKQAELDLQIAEQNFRHSIENSPLGIRIVTTEGELLYANRAILDIYGYNSMDELKTIPRKELYTPESYAEHQIRKEKRRRKEFVPSPYEISIIRKNGEVRHLTAHRKAVVWNGEVQFQVIYQDITERKQAEQALLKSEEKYRNLIENVPIGIAISTPEGRILEINKARLAMAGYDSKEEYISRSISERYYDPKDREHWVALLREKGKVEGFEVRFKRKDGTLYWGSMSSIPQISESGEQQFVVVTQDITERKQAEEKLKTAEQNFRNSLDNSPVGVRIVTAEGELLYANRAILEILGYSSFEELRATPISKLHTPESYVEHLERREQRKLGKAVPSSYEISIVRKDGQTRHLVALRKPVVWNGEIQFQVILQDITERKQSEEKEKQLQQELALSNRLAAIGELAAGVAHEINNPLTGIIGFSQRLMRKNTNEEVGRDLERIHSEALRAAKVVENLLTFARRKEPKKEPSNINDILAKTLELRAYELKTSNIDLVIEPSPDLPNAIVDFQQLQQVFLNIILNAEQAMTEARGGGKLTIKTQQVKGFIRVSFTDDGPGIPEEHLDKLFDPFFTTRGERGGTDLGLSLCHGIVTEHGGKIYARSKPGKGATFFVELPLT